MKITLTEQKKKVIYSLFFVLFIGVIIAILYPYSNKSIREIRTHSYVYKYKLPKNLEVKDVSSLPPAQSVPILMYHGVVIDTQLGENTERKVFISQMEMLKREGYQTISLKEYDLWRNGKFTLPPKPIIITFDDGRKDSYYTTDDVFKKLGFKATIFVATIKPTQNDPFYLSWDELKKMRDSGRWEIEAHGKDSHTRIVIDENNNFGTYLTSRIYFPKTGIESIQNYEKRVEQDYINVKSDLLNNLGIKSDYYAIPFAEYGLGDISNHPESFDYNKNISKKYFKYTMESYSSSRDVLESFYNYMDTNPYETKRLNVKNMSNENLLQALNLYSAKPKKLYFGNPISPTFIKENLRVLYGTIKTDKGLTLISDYNQKSTRVIIGDQGWTNYGIKSEITKEKGGSVSILAYYTDENNYIFLNWGEEKLELVEKVNGVDYVLDTYYPLITDKKTFEIILSIDRGRVSAKAGDIILKSNTPVKLKRGAIGFSVWDPIEAESIVNKMELIEPINY